MRVSDRQHLGNPLLLRRPLEHGVRVVIAHCATLGEDRDLDRGEHGPYVESFALFARLMDDPRYGKTLLRRPLGGHPSESRRAGAGHADRAQDWHPRLLNGSDYPLPGIMPLYSMSRLDGARPHRAAARAGAGAIREHNPLLFDFVLKRHLRVGEQAFPKGVFETRPFFDRPDQLPRPTA